MSLLYPFDANLDAADRLALVGSKAAGLQEMTALGIPVPPGFTLTTEVGRYRRTEGAWPDGLEHAVDEALAEVAAGLGRTFGGPFARWNLERMFDYRHRVTREACEGPR